MEDEKPREAQISLKAARYEKGNFMSKFYTLHSDNTAIGGYEHRLTTDGTNVNVQCRSPSSQTFRTFYTMSETEVEKKYGELLRDPYRNSLAAYEILSSCENPHC